MNCQYCDREFPKGAKMHETYCKLNPCNAPKDARSAKDVTHVTKEFTASSEETLQSSSTEKKGSNPVSGGISKAPPDNRKLVNPGQVIGTIPSESKLSTHDTTPMSQCDPAGTIFDQTPQKTPIVSPADDTNTKENKEQKRTKIYLVLCAVFVAAGAAQYFLFSWIKIHWIFIIVAWVIDLLILVFLLWTVWRLRQKQESVIFEDIEDFVKQVPKWAIEERSPKSGLIGAILNKGTEYKQLIFVSENFEPKAVWAEWDGFLFRIGNRAYKPARDVRGDLFLYHVDKKMPLIDSAAATAEDAEDSYHLLAVWNQAFSVGHAAALNETQQQIKMVLIIVAVILIAVIGLAIYQYGQFEAINQKFILAEKLINQIATEGVKTKA